MTDFNIPLGYALWHSCISHQSQHLGEVLGVIRGLVMQKSRMRDNTQCTQTQTKNV